MKIKLLIIGVILTASFSVDADQFHYVNNLIGDRAAGMGGAYTAISDDPSGCYYNPAGISNAQEKSISISGNVFKIANKRYKEVFGKEDWVRTSQGLVLNSFGNLLEYNGWRLGFSMAVPDADIEDMAQDINQGLEQYQMKSLKVNIDTNDTTFNFGPCTGIKINKKISLGATLYGHYRKSKSITNQIKIDNDNNFYSKSVYDSITEFGLKPTIGILYTPFSFYSLGISLAKTNVFSTKRVIEKNETWNVPKIKDTDPNLDPFVYLPKNEEESNNRNFPYNFRVGNAFNVNPELLLSFDMSYDLSSNNESKSIMNYAFGGEYYINEKWIVRAGTFSDFANTPNLVEGNENQPDHVDIYGVSLILTKVSIGSTFSLGGIFTFGNGKGQPAVGTNIYPLSLNSFQVVFSGTNNF